MKICQLCAVDFTLYHFILPLMRAESLAGHEVVAVCSKGKWSAEIQLEGFKVKAIHIARNFNIFQHFLTYHHLVRFFREQNFDIVHVHTPVAALIGRLAAARAGVPCIVYTAHGFYFHDRMNFLKRHLFISLEWLAGRFTDVLFTQAEEDAKAARNYHLCRSGIIEAIGNGVDPKKFHFKGDDCVLKKLREKLRTSLKTPKDALVIVIIGRLVAEKGYPELFKAVRGLNVYLWAIGERLESDRKSNLKFPEDSENIILLGHRGDIPELLWAADIFVLPSHREGMPRSIIEAMMASLPVIATNIRGSREEVIDGTTGRLVPVADVKMLRKAILDLVNDHSARASMGSLGRKRALEKYDESKVISKQLKILGLN